MATEAARHEGKGLHRKERENRERKQKEKTPLQERKTFLTLTGLLMEGLSRANEDPCHSSHLLAYTQAIRTIILRAGSKRVLDALSCSLFLSFRLYKS